MRVARSSGCWPASTSASALGVPLAVSPAELEEVRPGRAAARGRSGAGSRAARGRRCAGGRGTRRARRRPCRPAPGPRRPAPWRRSRRAGSRPRRPGSSGRRRPTRPARRARPCRRSATRAGSRRGWRPGRRGRHRARGTRARRAGPAPSTPPRSTPARCPCPCRAARSASGIGAAWSRIRVTGLDIRPHLLAEVGADDVGVALHLVGHAGGDRYAEVDDHHPVGEVHDQAHVVLDHDDRDVELVADVEDVAGGVLGLLEVHAGHRLVEQQQLGLHGQRATELDALLHAVRQQPDRAATATARARGSRRSPRRPGGWRAPRTRARPRQTNADRKP